MRTKNDWSRDIEKVKLVKAPFEHFGDKVTVFEIDFKEVVI